MKTLQPNELLKALRNAPEPVRDFAVSPTLMSIYDGIQKKHGLSDLQMAFVSKLANCTMLELEPESAIETNLHQALPELSHASTLELVADITTRILKEAKRRQAERILEPSMYAEALEPKPPRDPEYERLDNLDEDDPEWQEIEAKQNAQDEAEHKAFEEKYEREQSTTRPPATEEIDADDEAFLLDDDTADVKSSYELEQEALDKEFSEKESGLTAPPAPSDTAIKATVGLNTAPVSAEAEKALSPETPQPAISAQKLAAPSAVKREEVRSSTPAAPAQTTPPAPVQKAADPYREPLD